MLSKDFTNERNFVMFCKNCGNEMKDGVMFCANCGTAIDSNPVIPENKQENIINQNKVNKRKKSIAEIFDDDDKEWSEKTTDEKIETVYDVVAFVILIILAIKYHSEIAFAWRIADSKVALIIHFLDYLLTLSIWFLPLIVIKIIYFAVKNKVRKVLYQVAMIPYYIIGSIIASTILGQVGKEVIFMIILLAIGILLRIFEERVVNKNDL